MAEAVFVQMVQEAGLAGKIEVDSAGTGDWHIGHRAHQGTLDILKLNGVPEPSRARQIRLADLDEFDYVIVMDNSNLTNVRALGTGRAHVARLLDTVQEVSDKEVPDPYFTGGFAPVYQLVRRGCEELLAVIRANHNL